MDGRHSVGSGWKLLVGKESAEKGLVQVEWYGWCVEWCK